MVPNQNKGLLLLLGVSLALVTTVTAENAATIFFSSRDASSFSQEAEQPTVTVDIIKLKETLQKAGLTPYPAKFWKD